VNPSIQTFGLKNQIMPMTDSRNQEFNILITGNTPQKEAYLEGKTFVINPGAHNPINTQNENRTIAILDIKKPLIPNNVLFFSIIDS
jgi:predicted phosphodiesterase